MTLYDIAPTGFSPRFHATGVYLEHDGRILLLHRHPAKPEGGTWCVAGGKVDAGETPEAAARRETREETGVELEGLIAIGAFYVRYPTYDFVYHVFRAPMAREPVLRIKPDEHTGAQWVTPKEALAYRLIEDEDAVLARTYGIRR